MADWFADNAPKKAASGDWFADNSPPPSADVYSTPGRKPGQAEKNQAYLDRDGAPEGSSVGRFLSGAWDATGGALYEGAKAHQEKIHNQPLSQTAADTLRAPLDTVKSLVGNQVEQGKKAFDSAKQGNYANAAGYAGAAALPILGPLAAHAGETIQHGDTARGLGEGAALVLPSLSKVFAPEVGAGVRSGVTKVVDRIEKVEPNKAMVQAVKPRASNVGFEDALSRSMPELKATEAQLGRPIASVQDALDAVKLAKQRVWGQYEQAAGPAKTIGAQVDGKPIAQAMRNSVPSKVRMQDPAAAARVDAIAKTYERPLSIQETEKLLLETNAELDGYYAKFPPQQRAAAAANPEVAHTVAEAEALRNQLYRTLDSDAAGAAPAEFKKRYGALSNLERELWSRKNVAERQNPNSLSEQVSKWSAAGKAAKGAFKVLGKWDVGGLADIAEAGASRKAASYLKELGTTDSLIRRAFKNYEGAPGEVQMPQLKKPAALLGKGSVITPPPADPSGAMPAPEPTRNPGFWTPQQKTPLLERGPIRTAPPVDQSGPMPPPEMPRNPGYHTPPQAQRNPAQAPPKLLQRGGTTKMPWDADETSSGVPLDTVVVIDPATGRPYYVPRMPPPGAQR